MKKMTVLFYFLMGICCMNAQNVQLEPLDGTSIENKNDGPRSVIVLPTTFLDGASLTIDFPMLTVSQVVIRDAETGAVVYSAPYDATRQVVIDLSSLPEGTYEIRLYAFGKWWWGEFELITE